MSNVCSGTFGQDLWVCQNSYNNVVVTFYRSAASGVASIAVLLAVLLMTVFPDAV